MNLRDYAKGQLCRVRLPGICNFNPETTALAHERLAGVTGGAQKAPDVLGAHACSSCHDVVDGRVKTNLEREFVRKCFLEGVIRTQYHLVKEGILKW